MSRDFLGTGWSLPVETDTQGNVSLVSGEENIERSVRLILGTAKGERVMRPEFGCDIHDQVYASLSQGTLNRIEESVRRALVRWEPRIDVERVEAEPDTESPGKLLIEISYYIQSTNSRNNMVYPFYLQEG
jgi:phage baseplate assembly protein W